MTLREAAQQALVALELIDEAMPFPVAKKAIHELRAALAEPYDYNRNAYPQCKRHNPCEADAGGYCGRCHSEAYP